MQVRTAMSYCWWIDGMNECELWMDGLSTKSNRVQSIRQIVNSRRQLSPVNPFCVKGRSLESRTPDINLRILCRFSPSDHSSILSPRGDYRHRHKQSYNTLIDATILLHMILRNNDRTDNIKIRQSWVESGL